MANDPDNPYSPPNSSLNDGTPLALPKAPRDAAHRSARPTERPEERPREVTLAVRLLWLSYAFSVVFAVYTLAIYGDLAGSPIRVMASSAVRLPLTYWLLRKLLAGRNWARIFILIAGMVNVFAFAATIQTMHLANAPMVVTLYMTGELALILYVVWLLFSTPGRDWYQKD